jgi:hypothetical protein
MGNIIPIIKDLAAHDMSSHTPTVLVAFVAEPVVAQHLCVKIMCFKRGVMDMAFRSLEEEETVVVDELSTSI